MTFLFVKIQLKTGHLKRIGQLNFLTSIVSNERKTWRRNWQMGIVVPRIIGAGSTNQIALCLSSRLDAHFYVEDW